MTSIDSSGGNNSETREQAIRDWAHQTETTQRLGRRFSGERVQRLVKGDWLGKAGFVFATLLALGFVFTHDSKQQKAQRNEARAAELTDEPSVRDFRPPVMPHPQTENAQSPTTSTPPASKPADDPEALARQRQAQQLDEARTKSDIIVKSGNGSINVPSTASNTPTTAAAPTANLALGLPGLQLAGLGNRGNGEASDVNRDANRDPHRDQNGAFAQQMSGKAVPVAVPAHTGDLTCTALQGKLIDAQLETAINTDLPGQIRAIVSTPLYAEQGEEPLITPGSRLNGTYNTAVTKGQVRVFAIWNRAIRPDGVDIAVDSGATDALGQAGIQGDTDNHFAQVFGMSTLLSIIGAGAGTAGVDTNSGYNAVDAYRNAVQQSFARSADRVLGTYANIPPTNTVPQGTHIKVLLNRDLNICALRSQVAQDADLVLP